ncbi:unnamed protein product [Leptosia nina]|uniref:Peptidase S1 domain-containing protein n=1 Tax=Leptosia nina TaxID=320188 RepID=A0AAV1J558_9NEOP
MTFDTRRWVFSLAVFFSYAEAQNTQCAFKQNVMPGQRYEITCPRYSSCGVECSWSATCPPGYNCRLDCVIDTPSVSGCTRSQVWISKSGDPNLRDGQWYCGKGTLTAVSEKQNIYISLVSPVREGQFSCNLIAQPATNISSCTCGVRNLKRIVNGRDTLPNEFPMMAGVVELQKQDNTIMCGATIISKKYLITAAHCVIGKQASRLVVVVGEQDTTTGGDTNVTRAYRLSDIKIHPYYTDINYDYDIAILQTLEDMVFGQYVGPACLPFKYANSTFAEEKVILLGWGTIFIGGPKSDILQEVEVKVISQGECRQYVSNVTPRQICTYTPGKDACQFDSGGPLLYTDRQNSLQYLVGVISSGEFCASNKPGVNTRLTQLLYWIVQNAPDDYCEDSAYPACELNAQGPAVRGWRSIGSPPHELLLRLTCVTSIHKLQLLAHHQLIPACVEVLVSGGLVSEGAATPCGATYTSVGKVTLAKPTPQARTRELRSAALPEPTVARFVKLRLSGPHPPAKEDDQVALMAVNVLGDEVEDDEKTAAVENMKAEVSFSPYDDLAFIMYVDNEIADLVRNLDEKKRIAVTEERFEYARRLKSAGSALAAAGIRIGRWRLRKRTAAARDDFELARRMRDRIADALMGVKDDSELLRLFEEDGPDSRNDSSMPKAYDFSHHLSPSVATGAMSLDIPSPVPPIEQNTEQTPFNGIDDEDTNHISTSPIQTLQEDVQLAPERSPQIIQDQEERREALKKEEEETRKETDSPRRSITPNAANGTLVRRRNKSAGPRSTFEAYEERMLPALRHSHTNEYLREAREEECSGGGSASSHPRPVHKLNERERKQAALPILIFGYPLVEKFFSKNYLDKEEGLARLRAELSSPSNGSTKTSPNKTARAAATLLQRALRDKVFSVYSQANEVVKVLFKEFVPDRVCAAEVGRCLEKILPELLRACGDPAPRIHSTAQHTVLTVADCPHVRSLHTIPQQLVRPVAASMHPRLALSRLQMLEQLILSHGISTDKNSGLTVRRLAECGAAGAQHAAGSVRAAAERILLAAYARSPRVVRAQLPPDDAVTRRNLIYRHLFQQFDRIDMQKMLNQAPTEEQILNGIEQSGDSTHETSASQSTRSGTTASSMTTSLGMSSIDTSYALKSSASSATLAPSSLSGSFTTSRTKSSLRKTPTKKYISSRTVKDTSCPGYNKLRLDSAVSPKHSPRPSTGNEKVHFQDTETDEVIFRRASRNSENRHSMIHYDHDLNKPELKERPATVYEPLHVNYADSPTMGSPKTSKNELRSLDSLPMDSPQLSRLDLRDSDRSLDSPKLRAEFFRDTGLESPKLVAGVRNIHLDEHSQMDESGYYSPGRRQQLSNNDQHFDPYEAIGAEASSETTPEPICNTSCTWCGRRVKAAALEAHYWRRCVVLGRCPHCRLALEARAMHTHLLEECSLSEGLWKACRKCGVALRTDEGDFHANCIPLGLDEWKCPYCFTNILARDLPWQRHLMQCPRNPRLLQSS